MISCRGCDTRWTGLAAAHCSCCHLQFSTVSNFDLHRIGNVDTRRCVDPSTLKNDEGVNLLELRTTGVTPTWAAPSDPDLVERFSKTRNTG